MKYEKWIVKEKNNNKTDSKISDTQIKL